MSQDFFYPPGSSNSIVVPPGLATAANQTTQIGLETSIDNKTPTLGQKTMAGSSPVVIASDQSPVSVSGPLTDVQLRATPVPISGTVSTGGLTDAQLRATPVPVSISSGIINPLPVTDAAAEASLSSIDSKIVHVDTGAVVVASSALPSGAATAANQATEIASLASIDSKLTSPITVTGPLTDAQLRATPVPISGTVTANAGTNLNTSALSLEATQTAFSAKSMSAFINAPFDETVISYVGATTRINTVIYKLAAVTINTLTMTYDGSNRLIDVVKT